jgi:hypothetical protein
MKAPTFNCNESLSFQILHGPNLLSSPSSAFRPPLIISIFIFLQRGQLEKPPISGIFQGFKKMEATTTTTMMTTTIITIIIYLKRKRKRSNKREKNKELLSMSRFDVYMDMGKFKKMIAIIFSKHVIKNKVFKFINMELTKLTFSFFSDL